jgi:glycosyltransferase involved in cell wall biosynthesis
MKKFTLTIGIPAYNEQANILALIDDIFHQKQDIFTLSSVVVVSDGSTDDTVSLVKKLKNPFVKIVSFRKRTGRANIQNFIIRKARTDWLVLLDADTRLKDKVFLRNLLLPIQHGYDLTSATIQEVSPQSFLERVLFASMKWKKEIFEKSNEGNNVYTCHGRARGFSRNLYKKITFSKSVGEDAYSYFFCKKHGFRYSYVEDAKIYYKLPSTLRDHVNQSKRYFASKELFIAEFGHEFITREYSLSPFVSLSLFIKHVVSNPYLLGYLPLVILTRAISFLRNTTENTWVVSPTSKSIKSL